MAWAAREVVVGLSTSGNSGNILKAFESARKIGMITVGFTGATGGKMKDLSDYLLNVPSTDTPGYGKPHSAGPYHLPVGGRSLFQHSPKS